MTAAGALEEILRRRAALWSSLRRRTVVVAASGDGARALHRGGDIPGEARALEAAGVLPDDLAALADALEAAAPPTPCVVQMAHAAGLVRSQGIAPPDALARARVRYFGTDGVRGAALPDEGARGPLSALVDEGRFTPGLCALLCEGLVAWKAPAAGTQVVVAEDGRDASGARAYARAVIGALERRGCLVVDLGVAPTPLVPVYMAAAGAALGVAITASHNPAHQNGIKLFSEGRKLLPEPDDYAISAHAFLAQLEGAAPGRPGGGRTGAEGLPVLVAYACAAVPPDMREALRGARVVVDCAHGAYAPYAAAVLDALGVAHEILNADMAGDDINRDSGVAHLEGKDVVPAASVGDEVALVGRVRDAARAGGSPVFGIALDGDGDRGLLLVHDRAADAVRILDGDRLGFLLAEAWRARGGVFAGTVESDLAVFDAVAALGIETAVTPVGDKWLSSDPALAARLLVGEEASGHVVWPVSIPRAGGAAATVVAGNGLLTGLCGAAALLARGADPARAAECYPPGIARTLYTFHVDKARLYRGSPVWRDDVRIAGDALRDAVAGGLLPPDARLVPADFAHDADMLYLRVVADGDVLGAVFVRASGTENKVATYARGRSALARPLCAIAEALQAHHMASLKDGRIGEARAGDALAGLLGARGRLAAGEIASVAAAHGVTGEARVAALVLSLVREGRARREAGGLAAV